MSAWFRYERDFSGRWCPVVIYGEKPAATKDGHASASVAVPSDCLSSDGSPMFGRLQAIFPAPREET